MSVERIVGLAHRLGQAIGENERHKALQEAEKKLKEASEAEEAMRALHEQAAKIHDLEEKREPVEPEDKHKLRELQEKVRSHPVLQELAKAEADMVELMSKVNRAIREGMGE